jgi:uncharacterized protein YqcC (DUF446 family)
VVWLFRKKRVLDCADRIEAEMKRIGYWQDQPPRPEQLSFTRPFALDTMAFSQWLQFIFLPSVRERAAKDQLPKSSSVAAQAVREFDGVNEAASLVALLVEFDALF